MDQLRRLEHLRALLNPDDGARPMLFPREGLTAESSAESSDGGDVQLVDLQRLYGGE